MTGPAFPVRPGREVPDDSAVPIRRGRGTAEYEIMLARWPEESGICVSPRVTSCACPGQDGAMKR